MDRCKYGRVGMYIGTECCDHLCVCACILTVVT